MENQAYISRVHLKGYKSIRDMSIDLLPGLNIIIGPNGSGKTNFVEFLDKAFHLQVSESKAKTESVIQFFRNNQIYNLNYSVRPNPRSKEAQDVKISISDSSQKIVFERDYLKIDNKEILNNKNDKIDVFSSIFSSYTMFGVGLTQSEYKLIPYGIDKSFDSFFENSFYIDIADGYIGGQYSMNSLFKIIEKYEFNESQSKILKLSTQPRFVSILEHHSPIKNLKFDIDDARIESGESGTGEDYTAYFGVNNIKIKFFVNNKWLSWQMLSDGTKRIFYQLYNVFVSESNIINLEEPELGIHPDQLHLLMDFLKEQSKEKQIIITTHSPEVMNILNKDELDRIIVTRYDNEKGTQMHKLSPHQIRKGQIYMKEVGYLSHYWVHSNLEEYEEQDAE